MEFSHYSKDGTPVMVDVSDKKITFRTAKAYGFVKMKPETLDLVEKKLLPKGDIFETARIAGILGAKKNSDLIPMCHPLNISYAGVDLKLDRKLCGISIYSEIKLEGKTGAEMEALAAVSIAALTVYDMCKAVDKEMVIENIKLIEKTGGKSDFKLNNVN